MATEIRTVSRLQSIDAFDDPFGDKSADEVQPVVALQPAPMPLEAPDSPPAEIEPMPEPAARGILFQPRRFEDEYRANALPQPKDTAECANDRQCETGAKNIRSISLDITAPVLLSWDIKDEIWDAEGADGLRRKYLNPNYRGPLRGDGDQSNDPRVWKNNRNETLANGRLVNYANGKVVVLTSDGNRVRIPYRDLSEDDLCYVTSWWRLPYECALSDESYQPHSHIPATVTWTASALCHKPLYFEDVQLERYGHTVGPILQPFKSAAHFFVNVAIQPYRMGINPPSECQYALGYYRPGDCAPWMIEPIPISLRGAAVQAGAVLGTIYTTP